MAKKVFYICITHGGISSGKVAKTVVVGSSARFICCKALSTTVDTILHRVQSPVNNC